MKSKKTYERNLDGYHTKFSCKKGQADYRILYLGNHDRNSLTKGQFVNVLSYFMKHGKTMTTSIATRPATKLLADRSAISLQCDTSRLCSGALEVFSLVKQCATQYPRNLKSLTTHRSSKEYVSFLVLSSQANRNKNAAIINYTDIKLSAHWGASSLNFVIQHHRCCSQERFAPRSIQFDTCNFHSE
jgi:hypothetical protein